MELILSNIIEVMSVLSALLLTKNRRMGTFTNAFD